jgi:hypothetical protein
MKLTRNVLPIFCYLLIIIGCKPKIPVYDLDFKINQIIKSNLNNKEFFLNICDSKYNWDSIIVIKPYSNISELDLKLRLNNFSSIKRIVKECALKDNISTLLFIKNREIIYYDTIYRRPVDFTSINSISNSEPVIILNSSCNKIFLVVSKYKNDKNSDDIYYNVVIKQ